MQPSSEFPLFFQTAIALFGFLFLIAIASSIPIQKTQPSTTLGATLQVAKNLKISF